MVKKDTMTEHDQETFEAGLRIVSSARKRGVKPATVWLMLRGAMPEEYRLTEDELQARQRIRERYTAYKSET